MANFITSIRIVCSVALLAFPAFSPMFFILYLTAGFSDIADGAVARKTNTVSGFGSRLDTAADLIFAAVCMIKLLPAMEIPLWLFIWVGVILCVKAASMILGLVRDRRLPAVHTIMNKAAGALAFVLPLTLPIANLEYTAPVVCAVATLAAVQECVCVCSGDGAHNTAQYCIPQKKPKTTERQL